MNVDKATKTYWDSTYEAERLPPVFDPHPTGVRNHGKRAMHAFFRAGLEGFDTRGKSVVECGCGGSAFLPYFGREFGMKLHGIDYSERGCAVARRSLARDGLEGDIRCADFFAPPDDFVERFDLVVSFGVAEHFTDTAACLRAFARLLKPGGRMITTVPNMAGLVGTLQKLVSPSVYDKHVVLDAPMLESAHARAGLTVLKSEYMLVANFGVVSINEVPEKTLEHAWKSTLVRALHGLTGAIWVLERMHMPALPNRFTSPYVGCVAEKPSAPRG